MLPGQGKLTRREVGPDDRSAAPSSFRRGIACASSDIQNTCPAANLSSIEKSADCLSGYGGEMVMIPRGDILRRPALMLELAK